MTEKDFELQELWRKVKALEKKIEDLEQIHQLDMAEVVNMRRQVEAMEERR